MTELTAYRAPALGFALPLLAALGVGCHSQDAALKLERRSPASVAARAGTSAACLRPTLAADSPYRLPLAGPVEDPELLSFLKPVPPEVRRITVATGLEPLLGETLREQARHPDNLTFDMLDQRQQISALRGSLDSQLASVLFEIDCTGDTLEDLVHEFDRAEHARELKLTIASLVSGAVAGVIAGVWDANDREGNGPPITAAIGAGATAALGVAAFVPRPRPVHFEHPRNVLAPIVRGDDPSHIYPTFVFRLLTLPMSDGSATPAQELTQRWQKLLDQALPKDGRAQADTLLFGNGGTYAEALLELRETMLDQLESRVGALYRDLELLERYLTRVTAREATVPAVAAAGSVPPAQTPAPTAPATAPVSPASGPHPPSAPSR